MASEDWARDVILTELRRRYPDAVEKADLQEAVGIGPGDMRDALAELIETREVAETDDGYEWVEVEDRAGVIGQDPDGAVEPPQTDDVPAAAPPPGAYYRVGILLHVTFVPQGEGDGDETARSEAEEIRAEAMNGVLNAFSDLGVASAVVTLEAFDNPRQVI
jgi:hypothetical protein